MAIKESDVSILIPTYRQPALVTRALESALATGAGEIIVSDDRSGDDTQTTLARYRDPRLIVVEQPVNLGLWRNHLALLQMSGRPWVKFLQHDDWLLPGGLWALASNVDDGVSVVGSLYLCENLQTGRTWRGYELQGPVRWSSDEYMERLCTVGNELGRPSGTLFRSSVLERSPDAWRNNMSCDLVANVLAASRGDVVLIPSGAWCTGEHIGQDTQTQSFHGMMERIYETQAYLATRPDARIDRFASTWFLAKSLWTSRAALGAIRRGRPLYGRYLVDLVSLLKATRPQSPADLILSIKALRSVSNRYQDVFASSGTLPMGSASKA